MLFNIKGYIKVKLTDYGREILKENHEELMAMLPKKAQRPFEIKEDKDGWYRDQAWSLLEKFGTHINLEMNLPFETEIDIEFNGEAL